MKPWQVMGLAALVLNSVIIAAFAFTNQFVLIKSALAGAFLPIIISGVILFWVEKNKIHEAQQLQKINIIGFLAKVLLLGLWIVILIKSGTIDNVTFIVILLINFLAWHGVEAYYWPLFMAGNGHAKGENS
ncbi:MAG: hypothetical protein HOD43_05300 [Candidatus Marinimicrobia bacterium]|nr:hypothetical protein [Candidatus Neomarinimicrobiota bacterium]MBT3824497.1 hypothetical protein [Candidatus Neomarinimicrobiota bacterium]MBT4129164.1 hypothetical protein [Candidatus Neomarinimicrobiota bacterium]MBT4295205.1 hypothetical protein [Candidatus Neomarinimicrobiota bacterium]MBT4420353.1 hypothetical protein [Candidatus Neomarinimicrobiota bacterium]